MSVGADEFQWKFDDLTSALTLRRKEISFLFDVLDKASPEEAAAIGRSILLLLYAHWEGFVKWSSCQYLEQSYEMVKTDRNWPQKLRGSVFLALCESEFRGALESAMVKKIEIAERIADHNPTVAFQMKGLRKKDENLGTNFLKRIYEILEIPYDLSPDEERFVDIDLVKVRNEAAHGNLVPVTREHAVNARDMVFKLLTRFSESVYQAYLDKRFLRIELET